MERAVPRSRDEKQERKTCLLACHFSFGYQARKRRGERARKVTTLYIMERVSVVEIAHVCFFSQNAQLCKSKSRFSADVRIPLQVRVGYEGVNTADMGEKKANTRDLWTFCSWAAPFGILDPAFAAECVEFSSDGCSTRRQSTPVRTPGKART